MAYKVLIVDDSAFFQTRLKGIINECPDLEVVGIAANGQEAIDKDQELKPDVISMDYEMPMVDGITAVRTILSKRAVPIVMFSSMTYEGARITLEALDAGAVDFVPKNFADVSNNSASLKKKLHDKLVMFAKNAKPVPLQNIERPEPVKTSAPRPVSRPTLSERTSSVAPSSKSTYKSAKSIKGKVKLLAIGASTGGPVAVADIIKNLPADFPAPVVIVQHMPENFTRAFSERLDRQSELKVKEAEHGDKVVKGTVLVAPGGKQMMFDKHNSTIKIIAGDDRVNYKPCVDISFASAAQVYGDGVLAIVLTGMGADGCEGAKLLKQKGASIWAQNQETCVVYGMPAAIVNADLADAVLSIKDVASKLISDV